MNSGLRSPYAKHFFTISSVPVPACSMVPAKYMGVAISGFAGMELWAKNSFL